MPVWNGLLVHLFGEEGASFHSCDFLFDAELRKELMLTWGGADRSQKPPQHWQGEGQQELWAAVSWGEIFTSSLPSTETNLISCFCGGSSEPKGGRQRDNHATILIYLPESPPGQAVPSLGSSNHQQCWPPSALTLLKQMYKHALSFLSPVLSSVARHVCMLSLCLQTGQFLPNL